MIEEGGTPLVETLFGGVLPDPPPEATATFFAREDLGQLRRLVSRHATTAGLRRDRATDLVAAVTEVATNSIRHGGGNGTLPIWRKEDALVCEVTDSGHITDPQVGARPRRPPRSVARQPTLRPPPGSLHTRRHAPIRLHSWF